MEEKKTIRVVYVENDKCARVIELGTELEDMQKAVDGDIEGIFPFREEVCLVCNSMGKRLCKPNRVLRDSVGQPYLVICGSFFICDSSGTHFDSLTEAQIYNKLRYFEKEVLDSALSMMSDLRTRLITENDEIREIDIEVAKLCEQNNRYERYREKKIMDDVSYMEQTDRLKARLTQLRSRRLKLLSENENEQMIEQLKMLKEIIQDYPKAIVEFDETLFTSIVSKIKVCHDGTLIFELKGQLSLKERIEVSRKCA